MKQAFITILLALLSMLASAQTFELEYEIYLIPSIMTKTGDSYFYSYNKKDRKFTIYDSEFKILKSHIINAAATSYSERVVKHIRKMDPDTKQFLSDWTLVEDQIREYSDYLYPTSFRYCNEENITSGKFYLSQTLFDDDNEFEFILPHHEIIPIDVKSTDYYNEHSSGNSTIIDQQSSDEFWKDYGATGYSSVWDDVAGKNIIQLEKEEYYGGIFFSDQCDIVSMDGAIKGTLPCYSIDSMTPDVIFLYKGYFYIRKDNKMIRLNSTNKEPSKIRGDLNADGKVNVADHVELSKIILNQ